MLLIDILINKSQMKKIILSLLTLFLLVSTISCQQSKKENNHQNNYKLPKVEETEENQAIGETEETATIENDSLAILNLTKRLYEWEEKRRKKGDFAPLLQKKSDTSYVGIDLNQHTDRVEELRKSNLFTDKFIDDYNKIGLKINQEFKKGILVWNVGMLPPFGNGASPWCNCQDFPHNYLEKIWIIRLSFEGNIATYDWGFGDGNSYTIKAVKENKKWRILYMEGLDYKNFIDSFQKSNDFTGYWENEMVTLNISETSLAFVYHGQCVYFYRIRKIKDTEFEMIWSRDMDCVFDNGTDNTFGLTEYPQIGKPFAKFKLVNNILKTEFYYKEWVKTYTEKVAEDVFTAEYHRKLQNY